MKTLFPVANVHGCNQDPCEQSFHSGPQTDVLSEQRREDVRTTATAITALTLEFPNSRGSDYFVIADDSAAIRLGPN